MQDQTDNFANQLPATFNSEPAWSREELLPILHRLQQLTHEMAQPLTAVLGLVEFIAQYPALDPVLVEDVQLLQVETETLKAKFDLLQQLTARDRDKSSSPRKGP